MRRKKGASVERRGKNVHIVKHLPCKILRYLILDIFISRMYSSRMRNARFSGRLYRVGVEGGGCLPLGAGGVLPLGSGGDVCLWVWEGGVSASGSREVFPSESGGWGCLPHTPFTTSPFHHHPHPLWTDKLL